MIVDYVFPRGLIAFQMSWCISTGKGTLWSIFYRTSTRGNSFILIFVIAALRNCGKTRRTQGELRWVDLSYSKELMDLSGLLEARKLERLNLECCTSLTKCSAIRQMDSLVSLNLRDCINRKSLPKRINLKSLEFVILSGRSKLKKFPTISENIESLYLDGTAVKRVPESIESLQKLTVLTLKKCSRLMHLPSTLCKLKSLKELLLSGCSKLESFPDINEDMGSLEILLMDDTAIKQTPRKMYMSNLKLFSFVGSKVHDLTDCNLYKLPDNFSCLSLLQSLCLSRNNIENLPGSIKKLHHLKSLYLKHCQKLVSLPVLPSNLQYLDAHGCISLETVAKPMTLLMVAERSHSNFVFTDCFKLNREAQESMVAHTQLKSNKSYPESNPLCPHVIIVSFFYIVTSVSASHLICCYNLNFDPVRSPWLQLLSLSPNHLFRVCLSSQD